VFEFGFGQQAAVEQLLLATAGLRLVEIRQDLQGIPRVAVAVRSENVE
jgi:methylase of polypeptide subunit release factors